MYDPSSDDIGIIEINPRMSSQFGDLFKPGRYLGFPTGIRNR
jgi:hypothetical protein